jgi:general secretion pathway protein J
MMRRPHRCDSFGLTLIEVMISVAVFSMIAVTIWTATSQTAKTRDIVNAIHDRHHQVRVAMEMIKRDLASSFLSRHVGQNEPSHETIFLGRDHGDEDRLDFASFVHQRKYFNAKESDQCEVGYFIADDAKVSGQKNLIRRESAVLDLEPLEGGQKLTLVENIAGFELSYFDFEMNDWKDNWDTTDDTADVDLLPPQVRIKLVVYDRKGNKVAYGSQISIPMRTPIFLSSGTFIPGPHVPVNK